MSAVFPRLVELLIHKHEADGEISQKLISLTDSIPIITCSGNRQGKVATELCDKGYNSTKKMHFLGLKLHGIGFHRQGKLPKIEFLQIDPASEHDLQAQRQILEQMTDRVVFADKAFCDQDIHNQLITKQGELLTPVKYKKDSSLRTNKGIRLLMIYTQKQFQKSVNQ